MVRFNDKAQINSLANNDIMPITDMSDATDDRKVTVEQLSQFTVDNIPALSGGKTLTDNNLTNALKNNYDTAYTNQDLTKYDENISYPKGYWVTGFIEDKKVIKESMVDDNLGNLLTDETKWKDVIDNSRASINLDNLSEEGEKHFLNKTQITNCILSAPNGVATYSGSTITIKAGLKVLIPNGRNADGTLNNIEYVLSNDVNVTRGITNRADITILILSNGNALDVRTDGFNIYEKAPSSYSGAELAYIVSENKFYYTDSGLVTDQIYATIIGRAILADIGTTTNITSLTPYQPVELLKRSDKSEITGWGFPSDKYEDLTLGASGQEYTAPADGWYMLAKVVGSGNFMRLTAEIASSRYFVEHNGGISSQVPSILLPVKKGMLVTATYNYTGASEFRFVYAEGVK